MDCPFDRREPEVLLDYVAGRLAPDARARLEPHLASCNQCREFVAVQQTVWSALDDWNTGEISPDFNRRLYARIEREESGNVLVRQFRSLAARLGIYEWSPALPVAAACAVLLVAVLLQSPTRPELPHLSERPVAVESIDVDQVERALDDVEMLKHLGAVTNPNSASSM